MYRLLEGHRQSGHATQPGAAPWHDQGSRYPRRRALAVAVRTKDSMRRHTALDHRRQPWVNHMSIM
jgi:hypothetical protein